MDHLALQFEIIPLLPGICGNQPGNLLFDLLNFFGDFILGLLVFAYFQLGGQRGFSRVEFAELLDLIRLEQGPQLNLDFIQASFVDIGMKEHLRRAIGRQGVAVVAGVVNVGKEGR